MLIAVISPLKSHQPRYKMPYTPHRYSIFIFFGLCILLLLPACSATPAPVPTSTVGPTSTPTIPPPTIVIQTQTPYIITATREMVETTSKAQGVFFLSFEEDGYFHLFAYSPQSIPLTRLTADSWDDITPAPSPDGNLLAFSSRRNGYWDLYLLDLGSGELHRLTDTLEYDAAPTWSPDGAWIAYESYTNDGLNIFLQSVIDPKQAPFQLTKNASANTSPAWSPLGREIAFVSNRSGEPEIWIADLDHAGSFTNISNNPQAVESHPAWSPDGSKLAWASTNSDTGLASLYVWDSLNPDAQLHWVGSGDWPVWLDNNNIASRLSSPNQNFLTGYSTSGSITIPPVLLPGVLDGLSVGTATIQLPGPFQAAAQLTQPALFNPGTISQSNLTISRLSFVPLSNVTAAFPKLIEAAADSFERLRTLISVKTGWDALGNLEDAFIPLTTPPDPGLGEDWLYTGRAFTLNPVLVQADWMVVVREDFGQQVYWRIYLRTAAQDGSQGMPLTQIPWNFSARTTSSSAYENGGQIMNSIPAGYWLDLTAVSAQYGWQRLPALTNWRSYYAGARFNELVYPQNLDWRTAMLQLYPPEVLVTPTIVIPPTRTPTRTPFWYIPPSPTKTPTIRPTTTP
jgi:TolB protein